MDLYHKIKAYIPVNEQEMVDQQVMLAYLEKEADVLTRDNQIAHFSASSWIVNQERTKVVLIYHNIYQSWTWTGGHADGEEDLLAVAIKEAKEETGLTTVNAIDGEICSLEILTVNGHIKRGHYVPSHLHMNVTFLLEASEEESFVVKEDENSGVRWFPIEEAVTASSEPWMHSIYQKLNDRVTKKGTVA